MASAKLVFPNDAGLIPALTTSVSHRRARARALLARPWSARCYGVARPREGSRQNSIGAPAFPVYISYTACARALLARPWSARRYGVARPREGSRQNSITRRLLTNRPCSSLVYEESDSKERLRVSNWIVQRLYIYAVKKTVEL